MELWFTFFSLDKNKRIFRDDHFTALFTNVSDINEAESNVIPDTLYAIGKGLKKVLRSFILNCQCKQHLHFDFKEYIGIQLKKV